MPKRISFTTLRIFAVIFLATISIPLFSQNTKWKKPKYIVKIKDKTENYYLSGALFDINDSTVVLTCSSCRKELLNKFLIPFSYKKIDELTIRRKNNFLKKEKIIIGRNPENFISNKNLIKKYCYIQ